VFTAFSEAIDRVNMWRAANATPDLRLPSLPQSAAAAPKRVLISHTVDSIQTQLACVAGYMPRLHTCVRSSISVLTGLDVEQLRCCDERRSLC